jgi:hypothetical protein
MCSDRATKKLTGMSELSIKNIGESIRIAGRLKSTPLCVYGSECVPEGAKPITSVDRCLAKAIFMASLSEKTLPLYFGKGALAGCCAGGIGWTGYGRMAPVLDYFISYGTKEFRNGEAEYLKASPETVKKSKEAIGTVTPPGTYTIIRSCDDLEADPGVRSIICFGNGEQIRNLSSLIHFRSADTFNAVSAAWGPTCATLLTYPAGLAEKASKDSAYLGPMDPTGNCWFPEDLMALGIPIKLAIGIYEDLDSSFVIKRPHIAYPDIKDNIKV